VISIQAQLGLI